MSTNNNNNSNNNSNNNNNNNNGSLSSTSPSLLSSSSSSSQLPFLSTPVQPHSGSIKFKRSKPEVLSRYGTSDDKPHVLILYTGGTIGMRKDPSTHAYVPDADFLAQSLRDGLLPQDDAVPRLSYSAFDPPLDSSDMNSVHWCGIATAIGEEYSHYDGFVVVTGTDTMAYTASAVSFALEGLRKPVVFTGSQIPLCVVRSDGPSNLVDSVLVAGHAGASVPECVIVFDNLVLRANRTTKVKACGISGFKSYKYPPLGEGGVKLVTFDKRPLQAPPPDVPFRCRPDFSQDVALVSVFPGVERYAPLIFDTLLKEGVRGIVLETFGIGNAPANCAFLDTLRKVCDAGVVVLIVSRCPNGSVSLEAYSGGYGLAQAGCICGHDMTAEAAFTKLSWLLADKSLSHADVCRLCESDIKGELTFGFFIHHNKSHHVLV